MPSHYPGMATSDRYYHIKPDGDVWRITQRLHDDLRSGRAALPEYAGTKQKIVALVVQLDNRKPVAILEVTGRIWTFDDAGKITDGLWREHCARSDLMPGALGNGLPSDVVDSRQVFMHRKVDNETRWDVPYDLVEALADDLMAAKIRRG